MKIYSKLVAKIRNNKTRIKNVVSISTMSLGFKYGSINSSLTNLPSNSTQQIERVHTFVEEHTQMKVDGKVQESLSHKSSSHLIKMGSGVLIGNKRISEGSKSALGIRNGELGKSGPGLRAKADARRNAKAGKYSSRSTIIPGADALVPQNTYCRYHQNAPLSCKPRVKFADGPFQGDGYNNQPPPANGNFDASKYKGGPSPFKEYEYKDLTVVAQSFHSVTVY